MSEEKTVAPDLGMMAGLIAQAKALTAQKAAPSPEETAAKDEKIARYLRLALLVLVVSGIGLTALWSIHAAIGLVVFAVALFRGGV